MNVRSASLSKSSAMLLPLRLISLICRRKLACYVNSTRVDTRYQRGEVPTFHDVTNIEVLEIVT